ncbi:malto-oligosyltrehalose synthase [Pseudomonas daroniae]|uniref:Malto-oligosyltrehalose synthase n=1 Tax=Phytopseudomonas daroniae TaxID=2487519 RepID=A0A4Q9QGG5_9GAMM|nr:MULTISPECIES: malto-oligosyltrehalose synthase [Pseudomonas]TBU72797.1 malto-oligosyltrehalose synthase [Pseudomonas daroniae]TBU77725.1 malto-oligosyltrehalose synthase [Pseudomonas sp. FRB 228]TBU87687.1 malto-oligosyltrehalose synthase [Pseudomonas daroniae]
MTELRASVRLQFHKSFTLDDAVPLVDYFARLGISHIYASPLLTARPGSMHGYDVVDPTRVNPELGGEAALQRLVAALRSRGMGLILDIVSNHMAVGGDANPWWLDVLEWGANSRHAKFFDIHWQSPDPLLRGQLLVPFLRSDYGEVLAAGEIELHFDAERGLLYAKHYDHRFPLNPPTYGDVLQRSEHAELQALGNRFAALDDSQDSQRQAHTLFRELLALAGKTGGAVERAIASLRPSEEHGFMALHQLLERQHYRLASWRTAADDINWRRFFDINELGGLKVERHEVFEATHAKIFEMIENGLVDGLRIDHVDGLANPRAYCRKLRRRVERLLPQRPAELRGSRFPIYVEKILGEGEQLPHDWGVDGTTGYEFMNQVSLLQHAPEGEAVLAQLWSETSGRGADFMEEVRQARQLVLTTSLAGDLEALAQGLLLIARDDIATRDLTLGAIRRALLELIVHFPVYRTYVSAAGRSASDQAVFDQALEGARNTLAEADWPLLEHLDNWLGGQVLSERPPSPQRKLWTKMIERFQQLTSPAAAKAVEDTACYRSAVLLSRNDVGFDPQQFSAPVDAFHQGCLQRARHFPANLLTTATHDHKRGEDTRARLAVLSERAEWFAERCRHWRELAAPLREELDDGTAPSPGDELMLLQILLACWPLDLPADDAAGLQAFTERLIAWQEKAVREAKLRSTWSNPNDSYESACKTYLEKLLGSEEGAELRNEIRLAAARIAPAGALNSLAQSLLRMSVPGVPDLYQGCEFWDFSLVDPDNRRPVDFAARQQALDSNASIAETLPHWHDGQVKQALIAATLTARKQHRRLFAEGDYQPLCVTGRHADKVLAFLRNHGETHLLVVVPRLAASLLGDSQTPLITHDQWGDTRIALPSALSGKALYSVFCPAAPLPSDCHIALRDVLRDVPVNLLIVSTQSQESPP